MDRKILFVNFHFLNSFEENFPLFLGFFHVCFCFVFIPVLFYFASLNLSYLKPEK